MFCQIFTQTHVAGWKVWWAASTFLLELNFAINVTKIWRLGLMPLFRWAENFWLTWLRIISNSSVLATNVMRRLLNVCSVEWVLLLCLFVFKIDYCGRRDLEVVYYGALQCPLSVSYGSSVRQPHCRIYGARQIWPRGIRDPSDGACRMQCTLHDNLISLILEESLYLERKAELYSKW